MKRSLLFCLTVFLVLSGSMAHADNHALLIALGNYKHKQHFSPSLTSVNSAKVMAKTLQDVCGVPASNVTLLTTEDKIELTRATILSALETLAKKVKQGDVVFVFFYGHGTEIRRETYLPCYDTKATEEDITQTGLKATEVTQALRAVPTSLLMTAFEVGRVESIDATGSAQNTQLLTPIGEAGVPGPENSVALFSSQPGSVALFSFARNIGVFSHALNKGLRGMAADMSGVVRVRNLLAYLEKAVPGEGFICYPILQMPQSFAAGRNAQDIVLSQGFPPQSGGKTAVPLQVGTTSEEQFEAEMQRGAELHIQGKKLEAVKHYRKALKHRPDADKVIALVGDIYADAKMYDEAIPFMETLIALYPKETKLYTNLAQIEEKQDRIEKAEIHYKQAYNQNKKDIVVGFTYEHFLYYYVKRYLEAETILRNALKYDTRNPQIMCVLGQTLAKQGAAHYTEAEDYLRTAVQLRPNTTWLSVGLAVFLHYSRKNYDEAEALYTKALQQEPDDADAIAFLGHLKGKIRKQYAAGEAMIRKAISLNGDERFFHLALAEVLDAQGKTEDARKELQTAVKMDAYDKEHEIFERLGVKPEPKSKDEKKP